MKQHPLIASFLAVSSLLVLLTGCTRTPQPEIPSLAAIPGSGFVKQWEANLSLSKGELIKDIYVRESSVIAYSNTNNGYWLGASGGQILAINSIAHPGYTVYPPVALADKIVIPTTIALQSYDKSGRSVDTYKVPNAVQGPGAGGGNALYLGVSHPEGGRLAKFVVGKKIFNEWELHTSQGISAAPAVVNDGVFIGGNDGKIWGISTARSALWGIPTPNHTFDTASPITGDVSADDFGVYAASQDHTVYCLDRLSGKLKWSYHAPSALLTGPMVIGNVVYQFIPNLGLVAINKVEGKPSRDALWTQPQAQQILAADEKHLYVRFGSNIIVALDIATGEPLFHSSRPDMITFATNLHGSIIYAGTKGGSVLAVRPVLKPGTVGELVLETTNVTPLLATTR